MDVPKRLQEQIDPSAFLSKVFEIVGSDSVDLLFNAPGVGMGGQSHVGKEALTLEIPACDGRARAELLPIPGLRACKGLATFGRIVIVRFPGEQHVEGQVRVCGQVFEDPCNFEFPTLIDRKPPADGMRSSEELDGRSLREDCLFRSINGR